MRSLYKTPVRLFANAAKQKNIPDKAVVVLDDDRRAVVGRSGLDRWLGDIVHVIVVVCNWGCVYGWPFPTGWWWLRLLRYCASNTLMGPFHMAFCGGGTRVEVSPHSFSREIWAAVEVTSPDCFEECRDRGAAHRLVCELDAVGFGSDGMCE